MRWRFSSHFYAHPWSRKVYRRGYLFRGALAYLFYFGCTKLWSLPIIRNTYIDKYEFTKYELTKPYFIKTGDGKSLYSSWEENQVDNHAAAEHHDDHATPAAHTEGEHPAEPSHEDKSH